MGMVDRRRRTISKRVRFEIFKRDLFTCQYCGAQPPAVVLVLDHRTPIAGGGDNDPMNLVTACEPCNAGKGDRPLGAISFAQPDADVLYLAAMQEAAELRRYQASLEERDRALRTVVKSLQEMWIAYSALEWHPADHVVRRLILRYGPRTTEAAMADVAVKVGSGYLSEDGHGWIGYLWRVAKNMDEEAEAE